MNNYCSETVLANLRDAISTCTSTELLFLFIASESTELWRYINLSIIIIIIIIIIIDKQNNVTYCTTAWHVLGPTVQLDLLSLLLEGG